MMTFLPFGPKVTATASASKLIPVNIDCRPWLPNRISLWAATALEEENVLGVMTLRRAMGAVETRARSREDDMMQ